MYSSVELLQITLNSLICSGSATLISFIPALLIGIFLIYHQFPFKSLVIILIRASLAIPSVAIGLFIYIFFGTAGLFKNSELLFSRTGIIIAQSILGLPLATALIYENWKQNAQPIRELTISLGGSKRIAALMLFRENYLSALFIIVTIFSRLIGETGMSLMVGGNIRGFTQLLTTSIALETMRGNYQIGIYLGLILIVLGFGLNLALLIIFDRKENRNAN